MRCGVGDGHGGSRPRLRPKERGTSAWWAPGVPWARRGEAVITNRGVEIWQTKAACRGPHAVVFFPPSRPERKEERIARERAAKEICRPCPVLQNCLDYAIRIREMNGIWGGLNEAERKQMIDGGLGSSREAASA